MFKESIVKCRERERVEVQGKLRMRYRKRECELAALSKGLSWRGWLY